MNTQTDLSDVIEDSLTDAELPLEESDLDTSSDTLEASPEPEPVASDLSPAPEDSAVPDAPEVQSPASKSAPAKGDDFEKRFGIPQNSSTGRENRIPYSRVKKITQKAETEAAERVKGEYTPKISEFETKVKDYETKVADYEGRLTKVAEFEKIMMNDPVKFIGMLSQVPEYARIFAPLYEQAAPAEPQAPVVDPTTEPRPEPDLTLGDGSKAYSMEGLDKLNAWNRVQAAAEARKQVMAEVEKEYGPIRDKARAQERLEAALPKVNAQIEAARKWHKFTEFEEDITKALQADETLTLEGAYNRVVVPKIVQAQTDSQVSAEDLKKKIRAEVLAELKQTPRATSATSGAAKPAPRATTGPRNLESVIEEAMQTLKK